MEDRLDPPVASTTQQLMAQRLRQRYATCRLSLTQQPGADDMASRLASTTTRTAVIRTHAHHDLAQRQHAPPRFTTLFWQAYTAARLPDCGAGARAIDRDHQQIMG